MLNNTDIKIRVIESTYCDNIISISMRNEKSLIEIEYNPDAIQLLVFDENDNLSVLNIDNELFTSFINTFIEVKNEAERHL